MKLTTTNILLRVCAGLGLLSAAAMLISTAAAAEETCRLELIRMEPQRPGAKLPQNEWPYRNVSPQRFTLSLGAKQAYNPYDAEFKKIVKKEPEKYVSDRPFRGVAHLASKPYAFVLDKKEESSAGYDRLYFDLNGDGDLTDEKPIDAFEPPPKKPAAEKADAKKPPHRRGSSASWSYFPRVDILLDVDGKKLDYSFFFSVYRQERNDYSYVMASLAAAAYRRGELTLDGKQHSLALVDHNSNGRYDDVMTMPKISPGARGRFNPSYGDVLWIGAAEADAAGKPAAGHQQPSSHFLAKLMILDGKYYQAKVSPRGDEIVWRPSDIAQGTVESPHQSCTVALASDQASITLNLEKSKPAAVPAGQWRILSYSITEKDWVKPEDKTAKDDKQKPRRQSASSSIIVQGTYEMPPVEVRPGETTELKFGPPFKLVFKVYHQPGQESFSMNVVGSQGGAVTSIILGGRRPPKPEITITDQKGEVVAQGNFEYG